jgi:hypothetical protein
MLLSHKDHIAPRFGRRVDWHGTGLGRRAWIGIAIVVAAVKVLMTTTYAWYITSFTLLAAGRIGEWLAPKRKCPGARVRTDERRDGPWQMADLLLLRLGRTT